LFRKRKPFRTNPLKRMAKFMVVTADVLDQLVLTNKLTYVQPCID